MTNRQIENRIKKLKNLEAQIAELTAQADVLKDELKNDMEQRGVDELETPNFFIRWKEIASSRLDNKALAAALPEIYSQYCRTTTTRRFTIA